jgi:hypothetical protein
MFETVFCQKRFLLSEIWKKPFWEVKIFSFEIIMIGKNRDFSVTKKKIAVFLLQKQFLPLTIRARFCHYDKSNFFLNQHKILYFYLSYMTY